MTSKHWHYFSCFFLISSNLKNIPEKHLPQRSLLKLLSHRCFPGNVPRTDKKDYGKMVMGKSPCKIMFPCEILGVHRSKLFYFQKIVDPTCQDIHQIQERTAMMLLLQVNVQELKKIKCICTFLHHFYSQILLNTHTNLQSTNTFLLNHFFNRRTFYFME